ncbi:MAG: Iron(III) transport system permease protein, partial [Blastococcus sp.]|nr:Iron(III) transport system permease protein [Blastococcus sp.]
MAAAQLEIAPLPAPEGSGDESSARRRRRSGSRLLGLVVILVFGLTVLAPIVLLIVSSFNTAPPGSRPSYGLQNWKAAFATPGIQEVIWNTLSLGVVRTGIATVAAIAIAWLIARTTMPGSRAIELLF